MIQALQFILALSILIVLHEGGHFFFAKLFKTRVEKFYLFFDFLFPFSNILPFSLFKKKVGETTYGIGWFPLGGYVKIAGMVDESMDKEQMKQPPQPWEFRSKPAWQRLLIMLGGIIVNVLLAFLIYAMILFVWGKERMPMSEINKNGGIMVVDSLAYNFGFRDGDKIIAIDNNNVNYYEDLMPNLITAKTATVERNGERQTIVFPIDLIGQLVDNKTKASFFTIPFPVVIGEISKGSYAEAAHLSVKDTIAGVNGTNVQHLTQLRSILNDNKGKEVQLSIERNGSNLIVPIKVSDTGTIGFVASLPSSADEFKKAGYNVEVRKYGFFESFPAGVGLAYDKLASYVKQVKMMLNPKTGAYKGLGGFYSMAKIYGTEWDWYRFWNITATLSIILAFMNLLPIPGLDGGYVVFTLIEMLTGRKVNEKVLEVATTIGLVLLLALMLYANGNDIFRNFFK